MTLNEVEKKVPKNDFIFDRGISIRNLNKTLKEIQNNLFPNSHLKFNLLRNYDKLITDLDQNIGGSSCVQSSFLQGLIMLFFLMLSNILIKKEIKWVSQRLQI